MKGTLLGLILLLVAVLIILHGSEYGFPSVESFQDTVLGLPPWATALFFAGIGFGLLALYFGGRELFDYKQKKAMYYGFNMDGITGAVNPPYRSPSKKSLSRRSKPKSRFVDAEPPKSLRTRPRSRFAEPAPAVSLRSKPKSRFVNATKSRRTKLKVD